MYRDFQSADANSCDNEAFIRHHKDKEVAMKFLMIVLAVHFISEVISNKRKKASEKNMDERKEIILHPAEYILR